MVDDHNEFMLLAERNDVFYRRKVHIDYEEDFSTASEIEGIAGTGEEGVSLYHNSSFAVEEVIVDFSSVIVPCRLFRLFLGRLRVEDFICQVLQAFLSHFKHGLDEAVEFVLVDDASEEVDDEAGEGSIEAIPMIDDIHIIIFVVMKPKYITPRLAVASLASHSDIEPLKQAVQSRHKSYYHFFNLTLYKMGEQQ